MGSKGINNADSTNKKTVPMNPQPKGSMPTIPTPVNTPEQIGQRVTRAAVRPRTYSLDRQNEQADEDANNIMQMLK